MNFRGCEKVKKMKRTKNKSILGKFLLLSTIFAKNTFFAMLDANFHFCICLNVFFKMPVFFRTPYMRKGFHFPPNELAKYMWPVLYSTN